MIVIQSMISRHISSKLHINPYSWCNWPHVCTYMLNTSTVVSLCGYYNQVDYD